MSGWFPELADSRLRQTTWPQIEAHRDYVAEMLKAGVTQVTIHQRLRDEQGLQASVASLKRWVAANLPEEVTCNGPTEAINGRPEHLRGSALGFRNLTHYIARSLLETGGFRPRLHPGQ